MYELGDIQLVPFPADQVMAVDSIVLKAKQVGVDREVESLKHWDIVEDVFKLWIRYFPHEYQQFHDQQITLRKNLANKHGSVREKGGAEMQHVLEMPRRFVNLLRGIFPDIDDQLLDKKFVIKLTKRMPIFQIPERI